MAMNEIGVLPSWGAGQARDSILKFVEGVTKENGPDYIPPGLRIAVFDNDGTLWSEKPAYFQIAFAIDQIQQAADRHPEWADDPILNAAIEGDMKPIYKIRKTGLRGSKWPVFLDCYYPLYIKT